MNRDQANIIQQVESVTIASGATASGVINQTKGGIVGFSFPATLDGTTITFTGCDTVDGTFVAIEASDGNSISLAAEASKILTLTEAQQRQLSAIPYVKIVAGSTQTTTDTIIKVFKRPIA